MKTLAQTCERIAATTKKLEKIAIVAEYLKRRDGRGFRGRRVSLRQAISRLGGDHPPGWRSFALALVQELSGKSEAELTASYRRLGDLGAVAG